MIPWLSPSGRAVLLVAAMVALTGVWLETAGLVVVAELILAAMAWLYLRALLLADEVERGRIRVHIELSEGTRSEARVGDSVALDVVVENLSGYWLPHAEVEVSSPSGLRWPALNRGAPRVVDFGPVAPGSAARARVEVRAQRAGRWLVPGAELTNSDTAGWVRSASWLPSGLSLVVRPGRSERLGGRAIGRRKVLEQLPAGRQRVDRPGDGYDIRQLRTYVVGDDPRRIAWKATARRGRLMVRQHEDEVSDTILFVLDASGTMRGGTDGAKWEAALTLVADATAEVARRRDRVGLASFDQGVIGAIVPRIGGAQARRIVEHLVALGAPIAPDRTEEHEVDVTRKVVDYLILQERVDFRRVAARGKAADTFAPLEELYDTAGLERWASDVYREPLARRARGLEDAGLTREGLSMARRLADLFGLELTPRADERFGRKEAGLLATFDRIEELGLRRARIVIVSDLLGLGRSAALHDGLRALVAQGHRVSAWTPYTPAFVQHADAEAEAIAGLFAAQESRERRRSAEQWGKRGVPVHFVGPGASVAQLWQQTTRAPRR